MKMSAKLKFHVYVLGIFRHYPHPHHAWAARNSNIGFIFDAKSNDFEVFKKFRKFKNARNKVCIPPDILLISVSYVAVIYGNITGPFSSFSIILC